MRQAFFIGLVFCGVALMAMGAAVGTSDIRGHVLLIEGMQAVTLAFVYLTLTKN